MRTLLVVAGLLVASRASAELPTIESELPPALRVSTSGWSVRLDRVDVAIHAAPEPTFVTIAVTGGRAGTVSIPIDVPAGTKIVGLGVDNANGNVWGRPMPVAHARGRASGGALVTKSSTSADEDHLTIEVESPATIELALHLPPLHHLAIETTGGLLVVDVGGERLADKRRRRVVELVDVAGTGGEIEMPYVTDSIALVATATAASDFAPHPATSMTRGMRDLDKSMIRRRLKWFRPQLRQCFMHAAQWGSLRTGGAILRFMILPDGTVGWATTGESDLPAAVEVCLVDQVKKWEFPAADSHVQVNYPLTFHAVDW